MYWFTHCLGNKDTHRQTALFKENPSASSAAHVNQELLRVLQLLV